MATTAAVKQTSAREGTAQAYITDLELQKKWAKAIYDQASAKAIKAQKEYSRALVWETLLKECWANINTTDRLAEGFCATMVQAIDQSVIVKDHASWTVEAFKNMVSDAKTLAKCLEALKAYADKLKACLSTMDAADPLMAGLAELIKTIDAAFECAKVVLAEMLQVLKDAQTIYSQLKPDNGLEETLREIEKSFKTGAVKKYYDYSGSWAPCPMPEKPGFPLKVSKVDYYDNLEKDLAAVTNCLYGVGGIRKTMEDETKAANDALACYNELDAALKAAKEAIACKAK